jgi:hypothetical protein
MGCFNVACSVSNLSIGAGTRVAFVPLWPNVYPKDGVHILQPQASLIYSHCFYYPVCLPIFGEYDDYGGVENIEKDANVELIEKHFGMPIELFVGFNTSGRKEAEDVYGAPVEIFCEADKKKWITGYDKKWRFSTKWLKAMGFEYSHKRKCWVHPSSEVYGAKVYTAEFEHRDVKKGNKIYKGDSFIIVDGDGVEVSRGNYHYPRKDFLKAWHKLTAGYILYVSGENQKIVRTMGRMAGMFVHGDIWEAMINGGDEMRIWWNDRYKPEALWKEYDKQLAEYHEELAEMEEAAKAAQNKDAEATANVQALFQKWRHPFNDMGGAGIALFFKDWPFFRDIYVDSFNDPFIRNLVTEWLTFQSGMYACNRFFFPAMNGEQHGNLDASRYLAEASLKALKAEWEEYKEEGEEW